MSNESSFFKKYPRLSLVLVNAFVFIFLLGLFEIGLRLATPEWLEMKMAIVNKDKEQDFTGTDRSWKTIKDAQGHVVSFEPHSTVNVAHSEYQNVVHLDEFGSRTFHSPDSGNFVPFFGDSFTFGLGVDSQETFVSLLQNEFPNHRFLNLGIPGSGLLDQYHVFEYRLKQGQPFNKAVICFYEGNDLSDIQRYVRKQNKKSTPDDNNKNEIESPGLLKTLNKKIVHHPLFARLYVVQFIKQKMMNLLNTSGNQVHMLPIYQVSSQLPNNEELKNEYQHNLRIAMQKVDSLAGVNNIEITYILIPDKAQLLKESTRKTLEYYNIDSTQFDPLITTTIFSQVASELNIKFADVKNQMMLLTDKPDLYYIADNHFTPRGHREYAKLMVPFLNDFLNNKDSLSVGETLVESLTIQE